MYVITKLVARLVCVRASRGYQACVLTLDREDDGPHAP